MGVFFLCNSLYRRVVFYMIKTDNVLEYVKMFFGGVSTVLAWSLGGWDAALRSLVFVVVLDYISGVCAALFFKKISSEVGYKGIIKKFGIFVIVSAAWVVDDFTGVNILRTVTIAFFIANEGWSILENWGRIGLPLPEALKDALIQLKEKENKKYVEEGDAQ